MQGPRLRICFCALMLVALIGQSAIAVLPFGEAIEMIASRLEANQVKDGDMQGSWPEQELLTGAIVAGMTSAYELKCDTAYEDCANLGGEYILWSAQGNFFGDEAYALTRLSDISTNPGDNAWRTAVNQFYLDVEHDVSGTAGYISEFSGIDPSTAVFYMAHYTVAAYYVNANDRQMWRDAVVEYLAQVDDDSAAFPVLALGAATWALAETGPLDDTLVDPGGTGRPYWNLVELSDLLDILLSHQVETGDPYVGSFYWRYDHGHGGTGYATRGYTEDAVYGTLGLSAASKANPALNLDEPLLLARQALLHAVDDEGAVYPHLSQLGGGPQHVYAGEMLQALDKLSISGDLDLDGGVNFGDCAAFANSWRASGCFRCSWCNGADLDNSGAVDYADMGRIAENWLKGFGP